MAPLSTLYVVILVSVAMGTCGSLLAWRERPEPGAASLAVLLGAQSLWSALYFFELRAPTLEGKLFWSHAEWLGVVVIPIAWISFTLEYTGHDRYVRPRNVAALSVVPALTLAFVWTGLYVDHGLMFRSATLARDGSVVVLEQVRGPWFWVVTAYTYALAAVGSAFVLQLVRSRSRTFRGQSAALLAGVAAPWVSNALYLLGQVPVEGLDPTSVAFSVSGIAYLCALTRFRLLGTSPAPNRRARRLVFERMRDGAVVVDSHDYVVDANESAASVLGMDPCDALGRPAAAVIPRYDELPDDGETVGNITVRDGAGECPYDVTVTRIEDFHGRSIGRVIAFHDVSEHLRHQQRLEVLNRVLRHNIRNETNVIYGYADLLAEAGGEGSDHAAIVKERAMDIAEMSEKARQIVDVFERVRREPRPVPLAELVFESVADVRGRFPAVEVDVGSIPEDAHANGLLEPALSNLVENAAEHNTAAEPRVDVRATVDDGRLRVVVADNGPGIGVYEQSVLERGTETALEHGSGLGLWLVTWSVGIAGGRVTFEENEPTGSIVAVEMPALSPDVDSSDAGSPDADADAEAEESTETDADAGNVDGSEAAADAADL